MRLSHLIYLQRTLFQANIFLDNVQESEPKLLIYPSLPVNEGFRACYHKKLTRAQHHIRRTELRLYN